MQQSVVLVNRPGDPVCQPLLWLACGAFLLTAAPIGAQSGSGLDLRGDVQGAGGGTASALDYKMNGAIAQPGANPLGMIAGGYTLRGGLFPGVGLSDTIFSNGFQ